jgi:hypothetical protein
MRFGRSSTRAEVAGGACCANNGKDGIVQNAHKKMYAYTDGRESMV